MWHTRVLFQWNLYHYRSTQVHRYTKVCYQFTWTSASLVPMARYFPDLFHCNEVTYIDSRSQSWCTSPLLALNTYTEDSRAIQTISCLLQSSRFKSTIMSTALSIYTTITALPHLHAQPNVLQKSLIKFGASKTLSADFGVLRANFLTGDAAGVIEE